MAANRTTPNWLRIYSDGYDLSGYSRGIGPLVWNFDEAEFMALSDPVKGRLPTMANMTPSAINAYLDNTPTSGLHVTHQTPGVRTIIAVFGMQAEPVAGDICYMGKYLQTGYEAAQDNGGITVTMPFAAGWDAYSQIGYANPWGYLLHAKGAETGANTGGGIDPANWGASTAFGGYLVYQVFSGDGTATIKIDDSANNSAFTALSGATSGVIDCSSPTKGLIALSKTATVRRYLRWQLTLGTATTVNFALAFVRAFA